MPSLKLHNGTAHQKTRRLHIHDPVTYRNIKRLSMHDGTTWRRVFVAGFDAIKLTGRSSAVGEPSGGDSPGTAALILQGNGELLIEVSAEGGEPFVTRFAGEWGLPLDAGGGENYEARVVNLSGDWVSAPDGWASLASEFRVDLAGASNGYGVSVATFTVEIRHRDEPGLTLVSSAFSLRARNLVVY